MKDKRNSKNGFFRLGSFVGAYIGSQIPSYGSDGAPNYSNPGPKATHPLGIQRTSCGTCHRPHLGKTGTPQEKTDPGSSDEKGWDILWETVAKTPILLSMQNGLCCSVVKIGKFLFNDLLRIHLIKTNFKNLHLLVYSKQNIRCLCSAIPSHDSENVLLRLPAELLNEEENTANSKAFIPTNALRPRWPDKIRVTTEQKQRSSASAQGRDAPTCKRKGREEKTISLTTQIRGRERMDLFPGAKREYGKVCIPVYTQS
ncbi:hypothetical protein AVEN_8463-1 [Araneus ventricosus]|uniref:Uncharacterized protein n=1 Tax=Araneus ventricosus TaxID=182803 RepID=A0A4Y2EXL5_ARAVE|nr:hypothetical protein AVEN_8463-1 [Araneus ventricosus]